MKARFTTLGVYEPFFRTEETYQVLFGGAGSGKSYAAAQKIVMLCLQKRTRILCVRKVYDTIKESQFALIKDVLDTAGIPYRATVSPLKFYIGQSEIVFKGLDNVEKIKSIHGLSMMWIEEATECDLGDFSELNRRVRYGTDVIKPILTFNPVSQYNWVYGLFFAPGAPLAPKAFILKTTWRDNPYLPPDYGEKVAITKGDIAVYDRGEWGQPSGTVYAPFAVTDYWPEDPEHRWFGLDFGFNNPSALVEIVVKDRVFYARERLYQSGLDNATLISKVGAFTGLAGRIYADAAEPKTISEMRMGGLKYTLEAKKEVKPGINRIRQLQNAKRLLIHRDSPNLLAEASAYKFRSIRGLTNSEGEPLLTEEPEKEFDHLMDALRYAIYTHTTFYPKLLQ